MEALSQEDEDDNDEELEDGSIENNFTDDCVEALVREVAARQRRADKKSLVSKMYKEIAQELTRRGYRVTSFGCRRKYNKLLNRYKIVRDNNALTGREPMNFKYEEIFNEVMGHRPDIDVATQDSGRHGRVDESTPGGDGRIKRPKGNTTRNEEEMEMKRDYYETLKECEKKKTEVLEKMLALKQGQWEMEKKIALERWDIEKKQLLKELNK